MQSITYSNKTPLYINSNIPDENKGNASDFNDIKSVVNANAAECGDADNLNTTNKSNLVSAINEVNTNEVNNNNYKIGDSISLPLFTIAGLITNASKDLYFSFILPKKITNITTINVNSFEAELRGISGYLNSTAGYVQYVGLSEYTITATKQNDYIVEIRVAKSSAFTNTANNTPVVAKVNLILNFS